MSLFVPVPPNQILTSGANSALTWTNAVSVSSMNVSSLGASALSVSTLTTSSSVTSASLAASTMTVSSITANSVGYSTLAGSTLNATLLNYSSIAGSSISSNTLTLSLTNASTQNTRIFQVATTNPTTSYTVIQASHVSTGTTNNALALNPSGGNVGVGTTAPSSLFSVGSSSNIVYGLNPFSNNTTTILGPAHGSPTTAGNSNLNGTLFVNSTTPFARNVGASIALGGLGYNFGGGNPHMTFAKISGVQTSDQDPYAGDFVVETHDSGIMRERLRIKPNGTVILSAYTTNGTVVTVGGTGSISVSSDRRIKENIVYQSDTQQGLASVLNLKPATYNMIGSSGTYLGFIAQDVEQDIPLAVDGKKYEWQWEITEDDKPKFDANGDIVYKLDADGNRIVRPRGVSDRAIIATQTLAIQELAKQATSHAALVQELSKKLDAKSAALDSLLAWAQTMGYSASV